MTTHLNSAGITAAAPISAFVRETVDAPSGGCTTETADPPSLENLRVHPGRWWVLHTRSRHEKQVATLLEAHGVAHYLPLVGVARSYAKSKAEFRLPLFPGYLFLRGQRDDWTAAKKTNRVAAVIPVDDQDRLQIELEQIERALASNNALDLFPSVKVGRMYRVARGPLRGVEGVVERHGRRCLIYLVVTMLGQAASVEVDASLLEPAD